MIVASKSYKIRVFVSFLVPLLSTIPFLQAQQCPLPWAYSVPYGGTWVEGQYRYAYPGQSLSATMIVVNGVSPCSTSGEDWYNSNWMQFIIDGGYGWQLWIHQGTSDCRTQHWSIPIPFDNPDESYISALYWHAKGFLQIYVIDYPYPDPHCRTSDMDPVNTYTGALNIADEDYSNSDLALVRHYDPIALAGIYKADSTERWQNPIGHGWQHNYNIYIEEIQQINVNPPDTIYGCLFHEGEATSLYKLLDNGEYQPRRGNHANLKKSGGPFRLYKPSGEVYYFGNSNKIDSIVDRNGRKVSFTYSGDYLKQVTGKDNHTLSFSYDGDSRLRWVSVTEDNKTKKFEYRYAPVTYVYGADTFDLLGVYYLAQVLQHYPTGGADSVIALARYYYDNLRMVTRILPQDLYTQSDTTYEGNYKKGDRLYIWYNASGLAVYQEVVDGDNDTLLNNDQVAYRAYTSYFRSPGSNRSMDSTLTYLYQQAAGTGNTHDPYDTTFVPEPPTIDYTTRKRDYHYADFGRQMHIEMRPDADSNFVTKIYKDKDFNDTLVISADNDTTKYSYKTYSLNDTIKYSPNPAKIKYSNGDSVLYYYHAPDTNAPSFFLLDSTIDELSRKTAYFYDNNHNFDSLRYVARYVAGVGTTDITTDYTYNSKGNLTQVKDPLGNSTYFSYAPLDTGPYLTQTRIDFSPSGQGNEDIVTKYRYNTDIGRIDTLIYFKDYPGDSNIIRYTYDAMNRLKETYYPDETRHVFTYDKRGNLLKKETFSKAANYFLIAYEYDARDRMVKVKEYKDLEEEELCDTTLYKYDLNDNLIGFFNANDTTGISTEIKYAYDAGRLIKVAYPDTTYDSLGYYKDSNLKYKRDRKGKVIAYVYDKRDRLTKKRYFNSIAAYQSFPDSVPAETLTFSYDQVGNMVSMVDKNGTISYSYDGMEGLDTLYCYQNLIIAYEYDKAGNKRKFKVVKASDTATAFLEQSYPAYDEANRLKTTAVSTDTFDFKYWDTGPIKEIGYPNGIKEKYWLTNRNFVDSIKTINPGPPETQLFKFVYKYNEVGDRDTLIFYLSRPVASALSGTIAYDYDDIKRITQAIYPRSIYAKTNKYTYDKVGNRLRKIAGTDTTTYTYNRHNNQLQNEEKDNSYYYDDNGNMVKYSYKEGADTLLYDFESRLTQFVKNRNDLPTQTFDTLWFTYCGLGKRISKIEKPHGQNPDSVSYAYDGILAACEFGGHLDLHSKYVYANGMLLARYDAVGDTHYYHHDGLGSIMGMTDENKSVEQSYFFDEFGNSLGSWGNILDHYFYIGQEYDGSITQLYNLRARYYKSSVGRFISEDPVMNVASSCCLLVVDPSVRGVKLASHFQPQNLNAYSYCANSPINEKDILGMVSWGDKCILVADCYKKSCKKTQDPSHPCKKLMSDRKCEELARSWFRTCMGGMATETPPDELPFNDVCHEMYKLFFVPIGQYSPYKVHE